jgi:MYXO-CTERM domain-containing protein
VVCLDDADCPICQWCNAGACENQPAGSDYKDDHADDGEYCTGAEVCDGAGEFMHTGSPCSEEECRHCNEDDYNCLDQAGHLCKMTNQGLVEECHLCDGAGYCLPDGIAEDGRVCKDSVYSCDGKCLSAFCAVEVECDREECEGLPVKEYPRDEGHCRISTQAVAVGVAVEPTATEKGGFVPVRVRLANEWDRGHPLRHLRMALRLNQPAGAGPELETKLAYVKRSALLNGGESGLEEVYLEDGGTVLLVLGEELDAPLVLDLMLLLGPGPAELARFEVDIWAPCESESYEPGCHDGHSDHRDASWPGMQLQRVSETVRMDPRGGAYEVESDRRIGMLRSPVLGCQCATTYETGWAWLLWLLVIPGVRRRVG